LATITNSKQRYLLRVDLEDFEGNYRFANYDSFRVGGAEERYTLDIGSLSKSSTAGDSLTKQNHMKFSTFDQDNDVQSAGNCAQKYRGAWWYENCHESNLNAEYKNNVFGQGINWFSWRGHTYSLKFTEMKIRAG